MNNNNSTTMADGGVRGRAVLELVRVAPQAQVVRAGHIELAQQGTKMGYSHTTWKQRLFKLNATSLRYYKNEKSTTPKGIITLTPFCLAQPCNRGDLRALNSSASVKLVKNRPVRDRVNRDNGVALLVPEENRTYYIHFQSTRARDTWVQAINHNVDLLRQKPGAIERMISHMQALPQRMRETHEIGRAKMLLRNRFNERMQLDTNDAHMESFLCLLADDTTRLMSICTRDIINKQTPSSKTTLLLKAVVLGRVDAVRWLLENGADPNITDHHGDTPLIAAARTNLVPAARLLLEYGAEPAALNVFRETARSETTEAMTAMRDILDSYRPTRQQVKEEEKAAPMTDVTKDVHRMVLEHAWDVKPLNAKKTLLVLQTHVDALEQAQLALQWAHPVSS